MITQPPNNWKALQKNVNFIFSSIGLHSETEKQIITPRGAIEIDVYAIDPLSVDKITYVVECKNWSNKIPQSVVHSFLTVMQETGSNIGYIISKKGFQKGAMEYVKSTNIRLFTYEAFQQHYFNSWYSNYFAPEIFRVSSTLISFTEPINSRRFRYQNNFDAKQIETNESLINKYSLFANLILILGTGGNKFINIFSENKYGPVSIKDIESALFECFQQKYSFDNYLEVLGTIQTLVRKAEKEFFDVFGGNIFVD